MGWGTRVRAIPTSGIFRCTPLRLRRRGLARTSPVWAPDGTGKEGKDQVSRETGPVQEFFHSDKAIDFLRQLSYAVEAILPTGQKPTR